jgi:hypothetical protein
MKNLYIEPADAENDVLACAAFVAERVGSSDGHAEAMKEIIPRYLQKNEVDLCAQMADALEDNFARDHLLADIAEHCARMDDDEYALQLADAAEDYSSRSIARERLVAVKAEMHQFDRAMEMAEPLDHRENAYSFIAFHHAALGDTEAAEQLINLIEFPALRAKTYAEIAADKLANDKKPEGETYLTAAAEAAAESEHVEEKLREMCEIAGLWVRAGRKDKAIELLSAARDIAEVLEHRNWHDYWLAQIAQLYFQADSLELAEHALDMIDDKYFFALCLKRFAERKFAAGQADEALEDLEEGRALLISQKFNEIRDSRARYDLLAATAIDFATYGKAERAIQAAQEIDEETTRNRALQGIASVSVLLENETAATQALQAIDDDASKIFALLGASDAYRDRENNEKAVELLNEAHQLSEETPQLPARSSALGELAMRFATLGDAEKARAVMLENLQIIERILDNSIKATALVSASDIYAKLEIAPGDGEKAVLRKMVGILV